MRGRKMSYEIDLSPEERAELEHWQRSTTRAAGLVRRAHAILLLADGLALKEVVVRCPMTERNVRKWARRFEGRRLEGLGDLPRPGRKPVFPP
jgi:winged helix-turn helix protein